MNKIRIVRLLWMILTVCATSAGAAIVNNSGNTSEDSVSVTVMNCDSLGNPTYADSFFVLVVGPSGDSVFSERITGNSSRIDSSVISDFPVYRYSASVADIDGAGQAGVYSLTVIAQRTSPLLRWTNVCQFQLIGTEFDDQLAVISELLDSLTSQTSWVARQAEVENLNGFDPESDSVLTKSPDIYRSTISAAEIADTLFARDSGLFDEGYWHKLAERADSGAVGGSSDSSSIAQWVWNTPQMNHQVPGSFGGNLDAPVSGVAGGGGAFTHTIFAYDSTAEAAIPGARIAVRNLNQTALFGIVGTNAFGCASIDLDAGEYLAVPNAPGYLFTLPDTIHVGTTLVDTVYGARFDPGMPAEPEMCRVYGYLYALDGNPEQAAVVQAYLPEGIVRYHNLIVSPSTVTSITDSSGYFYLDLIPSDSLNPAGSVYEFTIRRGDGTILRQRLKVPPTAQWQLTW